MEVITVPFCAEAFHNRLPVFRGFFLMFVQLVERAFAFAQYMRAYVYPAFIIDMDFFTGYFVAYLLEAVFARHGVFTCLVQHVRG